MATIKEPEKWFPSLRAVYSTGRSGAGSLELLKTTGLANKVAKQPTPRVWTLAKARYLIRSPQAIARFVIKTTKHACKDALGTLREAVGQKTSALSKAGVCGRVCETPTAFLKIAGNYFPVLHFLLE